MDITGNGMIGPLVKSIDCFSRGLVFYFLLPNVGPQASINSVLEDPNTYSDVCELTHVR